MNIYHSPHCARTNPTNHSVVLLAGTFSSRNFGQAKSFIKNIKFLLTFIEQYHCCMMPVHSSTIIHIVSPEAECIVQYLVRHSFYETCSIVRLHLRLIFTRFSYYSETVIVSMWNILRSEKYSASIFLNILVLRANRFCERL